MPSDPMDVEHGRDWKQTWGAVRGVVKTTEESHPKTFRSNPFVYPCVCGFLAKNEGGLTNHVRGWTGKKRAVANARRSLR